MGFVSSLSAEFKTAVFQNMSQTFVNGVVGPKTWGTIATEEVVFYVGAAADAIVSEKFRAEVTAVILAEPETLTTTIPNDARVLAEGAYYSIVYTDDVAYEGKVKVIGLKNYVG